MSFHVPVAEMQFVLEELCGLHDLLKLPIFSGIDSDITRTIIDEAARISETVISPINKKGDQIHPYLAAGGVVTSPGWKEAYKLFVDGGWNSPSTKTEHGGMGLPRTVNACLQEAFHGASMSFALCPMLTQGAIEAIEKYASQFIKDVFLAKMVRGDWTGTMNLTEPQAGSDLSLIRTNAEPLGDHYKIRGQKIFITYGDHDLAENIIHLVLARLPDAPTGVKGISLFVVPKFIVGHNGALGPRNDVECISLEKKLGIHASPTCTMSFGEKGGAMGYLVGEPNRGLECMFEMMNSARLSVGIQGVAIAERAYQQALDYARSRRQGRAPESTDTSAIIEHPDVRRMLGVMSAKTEAARGICYSAARSLDLANEAADQDFAGRHRRRAELLVPIAKGWSTETCIEVASLGVQVHGGAGYVEEGDAAQHLRDARITTIYEGTTGVQAIDLVFRKIKRDGGLSVNELLEDLRKDLSEQADSSDAVVRAAREACDLIQGCVHWILNVKESSSGSLFSSAVHILHIFGVCLGACLMNQAVRRAAYRCSLGSLDPLFSEAKAATADFYAGQIFPEARSRLEILLSGTCSVLKLEPRLFLR